MEHDAEALPISLSILAELAQKGHANPHNRCMFCTLCCVVSVEFCKLLVCCVLVVM